MILLKFEKEIKGDSSVPQHENWITCDTLNLSVQRPFTTSGYGQDRDTSNPSFSEVTLNKSMDVASTDLFLQAAMGKNLGKATIHLIQTAGTEAKPQVYLEYLCHDSIVSGYSISSGGERPLETIQISFTKIQTQYNQFEKGGTAKQGEQKGFDLMKNDKM